MVHVTRNRRKIYVKLIALLKDIGLIAESHRRKEQQKTGNLKATKKWQNHAAEEVLRSGEHVVLKNDID